MKIKQAFTLAEVLITLVIIGVIAAMTIPTLINKTNNQEYVSRLKKTYSTLSQIMSRYIAEEGTPKASVGGWATDAATVTEKFKKYLNGAEECESGQRCFDNIMNGLTGKNLSLSDGAFVNIYDVNPACNWGQAVDGADAMGTTCGYIHIDVNGHKGPNKWGRDGFRFYFTEKGLFPTGCEYNSSNCLANGGGMACTCVALKENAINY